MPMTTKVELDKAGVKVRKYHQRSDARDGLVTHTWTHPYDETCVSCTQDRLPDGFPKYVRPKERKEDT